MMRCNVFGVFLLGAVMGGAAAMAMAAVARILLNSCSFFIVILLCFHNRNDSLLELYQIIVKYNSSKL